MSGRTGMVTGVLGGGGGGGSNMVSREDTAAMHRLIAQWLRAEVARLARRAAEPILPVERARAVRALLHSLGVLAVFFGCVCVCVHWVVLCSLFYMLQRARTTHSGREKTGVGRGRGDDALVCERMAFAAHSQGSRESGGRGSDLKSVKIMHQACCK